MKYALLGSLLFILCTTGCNRPKEGDYSLLMEPSIRENTECHLDKEKGFTVCNPIATKPTLKIQSGESRARKGSAASSPSALGDPNITEVRIDTVADGSTPEWLIELTEDTPTPWAGAASMKKSEQGEGQGSGNGSGVGAEVSAAARAQRSSGGPMGLGLGVGGGGGLGGPSASSQQVAGNLSGARDDADGLTIGRQQSTDDAEAAADEVTPVPEPTSVVLLGAGLLLLGLQAKWYSRRRRLAQRRTPTLQ
jgi:hypothetical protein